MARGDPYKCQSGLVKKDPDDWRRFLAMWDRDSAYDQLVLVNNCMRYGRGWDRLYKMEGWCLPQYVPDHRDLVDSPEGKLILLSQALDQSYQNGWDDGESRARLDPTAARYEKQRKALDKAKQVKPTLKKMDTASALYVIHDDQMSVAKIGLSIHPQKRFHTIQSQYPGALTLRKVFPGEGHLEKPMHTRLWHAHSHLEWFKWCDDLAALVEAPTAASFLGL